jgi:hypothetical protein
VEGLGKGRGTYVGARMGWDGVGRMGEQAYKKKKKGSTFLAHNTTPPTVNKKKKKTTISMPEKKVRKKDTRLKALWSS